MCVQVQNRFCTGWVLMRIAVRILRPDRLAWLSVVVSYLFRMLSKTALLGFPEELSQ